MTRRTSLLASAALVLSLAGGFAPAARANDPTCIVSAQDQAIDAEEQQMLALINQHRAANGRNPLTLSPGVTRPAAWFSRDMATRNYTPENHVDHNGRFIPARLSWCGAQFNAWAENIYWGNATAQAAFDWWRNSPPHNTNMLSPDVSVAGIARAFNADSTFDWYWTLDLTDSPAPVITGSTWYADGTNAKSGGAGTTVRSYAVGAFVNVPYQLVLATSGCTSTVAVLNPNNRFANSSGFISTTVGTIPSGVQPGSYVVCFKSTPDIESPTATGTVAFTLM